MSEQRKSPGGQAGAATGLTAGRCCVHFYDSTNAPRCQAAGPARIPHGSEVTSW